MTKTGPDFDPAGYAPVAERIRLFYHAHPLGRIETQMVARTEHEIVFKALVYREAADQQPAATGWAAEREGDGDVNLVACLENTETSAIGRALANLGFTASRERPSAEEMARASRARARLSRERLGFVRRGGSAARAPGARATLVADLLALLSRAAPLGIRPARVAHWQKLIPSEALSLTDLTRCERRLRVWIARQQGIAPT